MVDCGHGLNCSTTLADPAISSGTIGVFVVIRVCSG